MAASGMAVLVQWRDLGAQAGVSRQAWGPTLTRRMADAARLAKPINNRPCDHDGKVKLLRVKLLPAALYGERAPLRPTRASVAPGNYSRRCGPKCEMGGGGGRCPPFR